MIHGCLIQKAQPWDMRMPYDLDDRKYTRFTKTLQEEMISEQKQEFNQPLTMGDVIRVVDVDKESTYEQPTYPYDTGNASGNSLMTNHHRGQITWSRYLPIPNETLRGHVKESVQNKG